MVTFPLPAGYTNLQFQDGALGDRYLEVPQGFADTMTVKPGVGNYQVIFAFQLPYNRKLDFSQTMFLPTSAQVVMVPDNGIKLAGSHLQDGGTRDFQGTTYHTYNGDTLPAGSPLEFTLSGKSNQSSVPTVSTGTGQNLAIGLGIFGLALVIAGFWLFRQSRLKAARQQSAEGMEPVRKKSNRRFCQKTKRL